MIELRPINNPPTTSLPLVGKPRPAYIRDKFLSDGEQKYSQPSANLCRLHRQLKYKCRVHLSPKTEAGPTHWYLFGSLPLTSIRAHTDSVTIVVIEA